MAFSIKFDYRYDSIGFFDDSDRRSLLELAAAEWERHINDEFDDIPAGSVLQVRDPDNPSQTKQIVLGSSIDDLLIFVGSNDQGGWITQPDGSLRAQIGEAYSIYNTGDGDAMRLRIATDFRALGPTTDYEPFVGSIAFNNNSKIDWSFDPDGPVSGLPDLYSTAVHEIGHILGLVNSPTYEAQITNSGFGGFNSRIENGGAPIPLEPDGHVLDGFAGDSVALDPLELVGVRKLPGAVDLALLADIGYEIDGYAKQGVPFEITTNADDVPVFGSQAADVIDGLAGNDQIQGNGGNDRLLGSDGFDTLFGGSGDDILEGGSDNDQLQGSAGEDLLVGGANDDSLFGGSGYDTYIFKGDWGYDFVLDPDIVGALRFVGYDEGDLTYQVSNGYLIITAGANRIDFFDYDAIGAGYDFSFAELVPNQPPEVNILAASDYAAGTVLTGIDLISVTDPDGLSDIDFIKLFDANTTGGGVWRYNGSVVTPGGATAGGYQFEYGDRGLLTYEVGLGANDFVFEAFDISGADSNDTLGEITGTPAATEYTLVPSQFSIDEGSSVTLTISRAGDKPEETLFFSTLRGTASYSDNDYALEGGGLPLNIAVDFASGQIAETITLDILGNDGIDPGESFRTIVQRNKFDPATTFLAESGDITISEPSTVTTYELDPSYLDVVEGGVVTFSIRRDGDLPPATVYVSVLDGTAKYENGDFAFEGGAPTAIEVNFVEDVPVERIIIDALPDSIQEGAERFRVILHTDPNDASGSMIAETDPIFIVDAASGAAFTTFVNVAEAFEPEKSQENTSSGEKFNSPISQGSIVSDIVDAIPLRNYHEVVLDVDVETRLVANPTSEGLDAIAIGLYSTLEDAETKSNRLALDAGNPAEIVYTSEERQIYFLAVTPNAEASNGYKLYTEEGDYEINIQPLIAGPSIGLTFSGSLVQQGNNWDTEDNPFGSFLTENNQFHKGEDWNFTYGETPNSDLGSPVYSVGGGRIIKAEVVFGNTSGLGKTVVIEHNVSGKIYYSLYGHLEEFVGPALKVFENDDIDTLPIGAGEQIGTIGNDGLSSGETAHLHFELLTTPNEGNIGDYLDKNLLNVVSDGQWSYTATNISGKDSYTRTYTVTVGEEQVEREITWHNPSREIAKINAQVREGLQGTNDEIIFALPEGASQSVVVEGAGADVLLTSTAANSTAPVTNSFLARSFESLHLIGTEVVDWFRFKPLDETSIENDTVLVDGGGGDDVTDAEQIGRRLVAEGGTGNDRITGGDQDDLLRGGSGQDVLEGGLGFDVITMGSGSDIVAGSVLELAGDRVTDFSGEDRIVVTGIALGPSRIMVEAGSAILSSDADGDGAMDGSLTLEGDYAGQAFEVASEGVDTVIRLAGVGATQLSVSGERFITPDPGVNRVYGDAGDDVMVTSEGADILSGGDGADALLGGAGPDILLGGLGSDVLTGGADADVFVFDVSDFGTGFTADFIRDFVPGEDLIELSGFGLENRASLQFVSVADGDAIDLGQGRFIVLEGLSDADITEDDVSFSMSGRSYGLISTTIVHRLTEAADRFITTDPGANEVRGGGGGDAIVGGDGPDILWGEAGDDVLTGGPGGDRLIGGPGADVLTGRDGADVFEFTVGDEAGFTADFITDFEVGEDRVLLEGFGFESVSDLSWTASASGIALQLQATHFVVFEGYENEGILMANEAGWVFI